jgi:hypothetical protein
MQLERLITFVAGDRMESPQSAPIPETAAGQIVDISVELIAPSIDGSYTGYFELKNASGESLAIGIEKTFWVKILIGNVVAAPVSTSPCPLDQWRCPRQRSGPASCNYSTALPPMIANRINNARFRMALRPGGQRPADCRGADPQHRHGPVTGSSATPARRFVCASTVAAAGYSASRSSEIIYGSGYPQTAVDWWMSDQTHRNEILNSNITEMGVGYAYVADTSYGGYYTVDFATP